MGGGVGGLGVAEVEGGNAGGVNWLEVLLFVEWSGQVHVGW